MNLTDDKLRQLDNPKLTPEKRALLRCRFVSDLMHAGKYEAAKEALGELWQGVGNRPDVKGLSVIVSAEVLLQCGVLSSSLGSTHQIPNAQEKSKDLLSEALRKFQSQNQKLKVSETQYELSMCYFRLGSYDEARVFIIEALKGLDDADAELKAKAHIRRAHFEVWMGRHHDALNILNEAQEFFESSGDAIKGRWHGQRALVLRRLGATEKIPNYTDRAILEYEASAYHLEQAKHEQYSAITLNNLSFLLYKLGRYEQAHEYLGRARKILLRLNDAGLLAQVEETRARVLLAERRYDEALTVIKFAAETLEKGDERGLLADALSVQATIQARLENHNVSLPIFRHAINLAEDAGAIEKAGRAALSLIEEHKKRLSEYELYNVYRRADRLLKGTQDAEDIARLRKCARSVMRKILGVKLNDPDFSLRDAVLAYEGRFIKQALEEEKGSVTHAARRLGLTHQTLINLLRSRHKNLANKRTPAARRRRSVFRRDS